MNDMRKLMEAVKKINETNTMPTIKSVQTWQVVDEMGESVFHTDIQEAIVDYAESYAESKTISTYGIKQEEAARIWKKHFEVGKKRAQNIISKGKK
ncbi:MAG: hypothetical protein V3R41_04430 [Gammaproteobacteria bacterium]